MRTVDLATLIVSTDYLFRMKKQSFEPKDDGRFGDILFDLELRPYDWLFIESDMTLNSKDHDVDSANIDIYMNMGEKFTLGIGHRYESTPAERTSQFTGEAFYKINDQWQVKLYERFDFAKGEWQEQEYTIFKDLHCWTAELTFNVRDREDTTDYSAWLVFRLKAFPKVPIGLLKTTYHRPQPGGRS